MAFFPMEFVIQINYYYVTFVLEKNKEKRRCKQQKVVFI